MLARSATVEDADDFANKLAALYDEFSRLSDSADVLRVQVDTAVRGILER